MRPAAAEPALYTGSDTDRRYLLAVYPDGSMDLATRSHSGLPWSPPVVLREAP